MLSAEDKIARLKAVLADANAVDDAGIYQSTVSAESEVRYLTIPLDTAKTLQDPYIVGFPFKSFAVIDATDSNVSVNIQLATRDSFQDAFPIKKGSQLKLPYPVQKGFLNWSAQSGKTISILFLLKGQFDSNILNLVNSGGVSITDGDSVTNQAVATVTTAVASLFAQDTTRKKMMIMNYGGSSIFIGDSATTDDTGAKPGIEIAPGGSYAWENTAQCYAIAKGATNSKIGLVKFS